MRPERRSGARASWRDCGRATVSPAAGSRARAAEPAWCLTTIPAPALRGGHGRRCAGRGDARARQNGAERTVGRHPPAALGPGISAPMFPMIAEIALPVTPDAGGLLVAPTYLVVGVHADQRRRARRRTRRWLAASGRAERQRRDAARTDDAGAEDLANRPLTAGYAAGEPSETLEPGRSGPIRGRRTITAALSGVRALVSARRDTAPSASATPLHLRGHLPTHLRPTPTTDRGC